MSCCCCRYLIREWSAAAVAQAKREERLSQLIARAKASAERARASAQRAREIRSVGVLRDSGSEGSEEEENEVRI